MRRLIVANTYYQLLLSIQMNNTLFKDDEIILLLSNHSRDSRDIADQINKLKLFSECFYIETKNKDSDLNAIPKIIDCIKINFGYISQCDKMTECIKNLFFDEILFFNMTLDVDRYCILLRKNNRNLIVSQFEEGLLSYNKKPYVSGRRRLLGFLQRINGKKTLSENLTNFYCFYPELYTGKLNGIKIPVIKKESKTANDLKEIFHPTLNYRQKYIFFTSVYDFEGEHPVGEYELICRIAVMVGKDNLLVKVHPRDTRTIYRENGFHVDINSSIPWEAIQLSSDFSDKVFMTVNSGSVLAGSLMSEKPVRTYFMFKLCDISGNESCQRDTKNIEKLLNQDSMKEIFKTVEIAEELEDIL